MSEQTEPPIFFVTESLDVFVSEYTGGMYQWPQRFYGDPSMLLVTGAREISTRLARLFGWPV